MPWPRPAAIDLRLELPLLEQERVELDRLPHRRPGRTCSWAGSRPLKTKPQSHLPPPRHLSHSLPSRRARGNRRAAVILAGAFNPLHAGHRRMAEIAEEVLGLPVALEISILNVDKPALDYLEIDRRLGQFPPEQAVWLTRAATFDDKSRLFPGATFVVGVDTLRRIADPRYYGNDRSVMEQSLQRIIARNCRFLVFGRALGSSFIRLSDLDLPDALRQSAARFRRRSSARMCRPRRCEKRVRLVEKAMPRAISNIDDDFRQPAVAGSLDFQAVPGDGLDLHVELMPGRVHRLAAGGGLQPASLPQR